MSEHMTSLALAQADLATAEATLRAALLRGEDTAAARDFVAECRREVAGLRESVADADETAEAEAGRQVAIRAQAIVDAADASRAAQLARLTPAACPATGTQHGCVVAANKIASLARSIAEAEVESGAREALARAEDHAAQIAGRISALTSQRGAIVARRTAGHYDDGDGPALALIAADLEGLAGLQAEAEAKVAAARVPVTAASNRLASLRDQLARAEAEAVEAVLIAQATQQAEVLLQTVGGLEQAGKGLNRQMPVWSSPALYRALQGLAIRRRET